MRCPYCTFENPDGFKYCGECGKRLLTEKDRSRAVALCHDLNESLAQHLRELERHPERERSKMASDFVNRTGMPGAQVMDRMRRLEKHLKAREYDSAASVKAPVKGLADYYQHLQRHAEQSEEDPSKRKETLKFVGHCASTAIELAGLIATVLG